MGLFDKLRKKHDTTDTVKKPVHVVDAKTEKAKADKPAEAKEKSKAETPRVLKTDTRHAHRVLLRPLLTEKSTRLQASGQYVFAVSATVSKIEVREAVYAVYGVRPVHVTTRVVRGKVVRFGRTQGRQKTWKKAVVTLPAGKTISIS
ncbi:MAG: 50S ribosomal protein L23 [Patescibacteria group bacterium]